MSLHVAHQIFLLSLLTFGLSLLVHLRVTHQKESEDGNKSRNHESTKDFLDPTSYNRSSWIPSSNDTNDSYFYDIKSGSRSCPSLDGRYMISPPLKYHNDCLYVLINESSKRNWEDSYSYCKSKNAQLLVIESTGQVTFLQEFLVKRFPNLASLAFWVQKSALSFNSGPSSAQNGDLYTGNIEASCTELKFISNRVEDESGSDLSEIKVTYNPVVLRYNKESLSCSKPNYFICKISNNYEAIDVVERDDSITDCNATLYLTLQKPVINFKSPKYPNLYPNNLDCNILLVNQYPGADIVLVFQSFNLEPSLGCIKDRLEISNVRFSNLSSHVSNMAQKKPNWARINNYEIMKDNSKLFSTIGDLPKGRYCGNWDKKIKLLKFRTSFIMQPTTDIESYQTQITNNLLLRFITDDETTDSGYIFKAFLELKNDDKNVQKRIKSNTLAIKEQTEGTYTSPNYPSKYPDNINMTVIIEAPLHSRIEVKFSFFNVEFQDECLYDFITISDDSRVGHLRFCGIAYSTSIAGINNQAVDSTKPQYSIISNSYNESAHNDLGKTNTPFNYISINNRVVINFFSDDSINGLGFVFEWKILDLEICRSTVITSSDSSIDNSDVANTFVSFSRLDIPYIKCRTRFESKELNVGIFVEITDIELDNEVDHTSCLEEYIFISENDEKGDESYYNYFNSTWNNPVNEYPGSPKNLDIPPPLGNGLIICPKNFYKWNNRYFSRSSVLDVWYIKSTSGNIFKGYKIKFRFVSLLILNETIKINQPLHTGFFTTLNYPTPQPYNVSYKILLISDQKANIKLFARGLSYQSTYNDTVSLKQVLNFDDINNGCMLPAPRKYCESNNRITIVDPLWSPDNIIRRQIYCGVNFVQRNLKNKDMSSKEDIHLFKQTEPGTPIHILTSNLHALIIEISSIGFSTIPLYPIMFLWELVPADFDSKIEVVSNPYTDCSFDLCSNNGTCDTFDECSCIPPYTGKFCLTNPCQKNPCAFGRCVISDQTYKCECDEMHTGHLCQYQVCDTNICNNQGMCHLDSGVEVCACYPGYAGDRCDQTFPIIKDLSPSEKFFQEPFWMGIFLVIIVLILLGLIMLYQKKWAGEYKLIFCDDCFARRVPKNIIGRRQSSSPTYLKGDKPLGRIEMMIESSLFPRRATSPDIGQHKGLTNYLPTTSHHIMSNMNASTDSGTDGPPSYSSTLKNDGSTTNLATATSTLMSPLFACNKIFNRRRRLSGHNKNLKPLHIDINNRNDKISKDSSSLLLAYSSTFGVTFDGGCLDRDSETPPALVALRSPLDFKALTNMESGLSRAYSFPNLSPDINNSTSRKRGQEDVEEKNVRFNLAIRGSEILHADGEYSNIGYSSTHSSTTSPSSGRTATTPV